MKGALNGVLVSSTHERVVPSRGGDATRYFMVFGNSKFDRSL